MPICISLKVDAGIVLAADTTTVLTWRDPFAGKGSPAGYTVNRSNIHALSEEIRIGLLSWGTGTLLQRSIGSWIKIFLSDLKNNVRNLGRFTVPELTNMLGAFFQVRYLATYGQSALKPDFGIAVAGYSDSGQLPELWAVAAEGGEWWGPAEVRSKTGFGVDWFGTSDSLERLVSKAGREPGGGAGKRQPSDAFDNRIVGPFQEDLYPGLWDPAMSIEVALDVAVSLIQTSLAFVKDFPGIPLFGGCIELAAVSRVEGFRWVQMG